MIAVHEHCSQLLKPIGRIVYVLHHIMRRGEEGGGSGNGYGGLNDVKETAVRLERIERRDRRQPPRHLHPLP
jgi:hypothetical protein